MVFKRLSAIYCENSGKYGRIFDKKAPSGVCFLDFLLSFYMRKACVGVISRLSVLLRVFCDEYLKFPVKTLYLPKNDKY